LNWEAILWFRTTGIQLLGAVALAASATAQTAPAPSAIPRTVVAATKLPTVTDVPLHLHEMVASSLAPAQMDAEKGTATLVHGGVRHTTIPESFWGRWAPGTEVCKNADKSVIVLSATTYVSSEANCTVDWVAETAGARGPIYSARIQCSNRAGKAQRTISDLIILPRDANQISVGSEFGSLKIYQRCSPNEPAATQ
jgi:hypothetical protein